MGAIWIIGIYREGPRFKVSVFSVYDILVNDNHRGCLDASRARSGQQATQTSCQRSARSLAQRMWITERIWGFLKVKGTF